MNQNQPLTEKKICEGVYILENPKKKYVYHNNTELIALYEAEFEELGNQIKNMFKANEEMLAYDPNDYDLIQAREENLQLINEKIIRMKNIQEQIKGICPNHPCVSLNVFDVFNENKKENIITEIEL